ncbi:MAG TPA: NAD-dependent epimerase/dehydratase family protein [Ktedonobacterales bacterium]
MYLVTGGGGFIGAHLVRALVRRGERVRVLDDESTGRRGRLRDVWDGVEWIAGDVRDEAAVARACQGVEVVLHHAAVASVPASVADPLGTHAVNVGGTLNVLRAAQAAGARRVVFASSTAVYGDLPGSPKSEDMPVLPRTPYAVQKLAAESYCRIWQPLYGLETVALRYFNVFGPGQDPNGAYAAVIPRFIAALRAGQEPVIYGDGEQSRDFIYVGNVVEINLLAATVPAAAGQVLNVGTGARTTLNGLVRDLEAICERPIHPVHEPERPGDIHESVADISRLRAVLGYEPTVPFARGLAWTVQAFEEDGARM